MSKLYELTRIDPVSGEAIPVPAAERADALLSHPQAREVIRTMDPQSLYSLVHEAGLEDAHELVLYASPEQVQAIIDFDCWTRDEFATERLDSWLEVLLQREDDDLHDWFSQAEIEPFVIWLREQTQVFQWEEDMELLDIIDAPVMTSPDGVYAIVVPDEERLGPLLRLFLERVYSHDILYGHRLLEAARWEMTSDLNEHAFQRRTARMGDLGFVPFHEAMEVFAWTDPTRWAAKARATANDADAQPLTFEAGALPPVDAQIQVLEQRRFEGAGSAFTRAMASLPDAFGEIRLEAIVDGVISQFRAITNRAHVANLGNPGDLESARKAAERVDAMLSIALEMAAGPDHVLAAHILAKTRLIDAHRAGYAATLKLQRQAQQLVERGNLTLTDAPTSLLDPDQSDLVEGLLRKRPTMSGTYDTPFRALEDVEQAARRLSEIAFCELLFFGIFKHRRDEIVEMVFDEARNATPVEDIRFRTLFATRLFAELRRPGVGLEPIPLEEVHAVCAVLAKREEPVETLIDHGVGLVRAAQDEGDALRTLATAFAARVAGWLLDELGDLRQPVPSSVASQLFLLAP